MKELIQFYKTECFDNEDITNDWIANDFQNSHGIDIFIEKLNYPNKVNNPTNKEILFEWFCHWLWGTTKPNQDPIHPIANKPTPGIEPFTVDRSKDPIQTVAKKFEFQLKIKINSLKRQPQIAKSMAQSFMTICKNDDYTELDELDSDLESIEDSFIIVELIRQYSKYTNRKDIIFNMLQHIVSMLKYDNYPPFNLTRFKCKFSKKTFDRANKLCMHFIPSFFKNKVEFTELKTSEIEDNKDNKDLELMNAKALDFENNFPLLINLFDAYSRFRADSNEMFWNTTEMTPNQNKQNEHISVKLKANEWWTQYCGYAKYLKQQNKYIYICLANALAATGKRPLPLFNFNHVIGETIFDSYDIFTRYTCAFNAFLYGLLGEENGTVPFQIDLWIIPRLSKTGIHHDHGLPPGFNDIKMDFSDDENDDDKTMDEMMSGKIQELGKNEGTSGEYGKIWNIENKLMEDEYKLNDDYWRYPEKAFSNNDGNISMNKTFNHIELVRNFIDLWGLYNEYIEKKNDDISYKRFILVIDRRDPKHIKNKKMDDEKINNDQTWYDRMYLIRPKKYTMEVKQKMSKNKDGNNNNNNSNEKHTIYRDEICKLYDFTMNETFIGNTMEYLFPMVKLRQNEYRYDFSGLDSGNGYKFVISYHVHFCNKVKMYWYFGQGAIRFFMNDIYWLWPRYFNPVPADHKNTSESFQILSRDGKIELENAIKDYPLIDKQYKQFADQLATFKELITIDH